MVATRSRGSFHCGSLITRVPEIAIVIMNVDVNCNVQPGMRCRRFPESSVMAAAIGLMVPPGATSEAPCSGCRERPPPPSAIAPTLATALGLT